MRINTQISFVPDGAITRVHVVAFDLSHADPQKPIFQFAYDSAVPPPDGIIDVPAFLENLTRQLHAKIKLDRRQVGPLERTQSQRFLS